MTIEAPTDLHPPLRRPPAVEPAHRHGGIATGDFRRGSGSALCPLQWLRRVAVFRPLMLGEMLCALPALRTLRAAVPQARLTLVGLPWCEALAQRLPMIDAFMAYPGVPGAPTQAPDPAALRHFVAAAREERFDLVLQMQGAVWTANRVAESFGARLTAGFYDERVSDEFSGRQSPLHTAWPHRGHESQRLQRLTAHLGMPALETPLEFPLRDEDRDDLVRLWPGGEPARPYVCIHPGAGKPWRRWPVERFAAVADRLGERGWTVVITGDAAERDLAERMRQAMRTTPVVLAGRTTLWTLGAVIEGATLLLANDSGVTVLADALGTPCVVVSGGSEVDRWAPVDRRRHYVLYQHDGEAPRPLDEAAEPACARMIGAREVSAAVEAMLG